MSCFGIETHLENITERNKFHIPSRYMRSSMIKIIFESVNILKITFKVILMILPYSLRTNRIYNLFNNINLRHKSDHCLLLLLTTPFHNKMELNINKNCSYEVVK